jgi:hypothetical protein
MSLSWREEAKVLAIWTYFDESEEHLDSRCINMSIGGVYSSLDRSQTLEAD